MGGLTSLHAVLDDPSLFAGIITSAPFLDAPVNQRMPDLVIRLLSLLAAVIPKAKLFTVDGRVTHDPAVLAADANDPLMYAP